MKVLVRSQSLHFLRAFQQLASFTLSEDFKCWIAIPSFSQGISTYLTASGKNPEARSQSLHFLRAFQLAMTKIKWVLKNGDRNPFIFLGHFNLYEGGKVEEREGFRIAIPSFSQGISTIEKKEFMEFVKNVYRNPFIFLGHFNNNIVKADENTKRVLIAIPSFSQGISTGLR